MKIIHCSDLHLDSKLNTNFTAQMAHERNQEICRTFERMVEYANENTVRIILLCGDLFDSNYVSRTTEAYILDVITRYPHIQFLYLRGNHNKCSFLNSHSVPQNLRDFGERWKYYRCGNVVIAGIEINQNNAHSLYDTLSLDSQHINVVMMHGQVGSESGIDKINLPLLKNKNIDYLALGHIHSHQIDQLDYRGSYCYSGCLEGRGFDETGKKGFVLLDINNHSIQNQFIEFSSRNFHKIETDITGLHKITEILQHIRAECVLFAKEDLLQITLAGQNTTEAPIDTQFLQTLLAEDYYYVKILDESKLHSDTVRNTVYSLQNEFIHSVNSDLSLTDFEREQILQLGLSALNGEELNI